LFYPKTDSATFVGWPSQADPTCLEAAGLGKMVGLGRPTYESGAVEVMGI
jgi:hypothetical protein